MDRKFQRYIDDLYRLGFSHREIGLYLGLAEKTVRKYVSVPKGERIEEEVDRYFEKHMPEVQKFSEAKRAKTEKKTSARVFLNEKAPTMLKTDAIKELYKYQVTNPEKYYRDWRNEYVSG